MERRAYVCHSKDCDPPRRVFLLPGDAIPKCHGRAMVRQANMPYMAGKSKRPTGRAVPKPDAAATR